MCAYLIAPIMTTFANASIHTKCFASDWKLSSRVSRVTPIYKGKGDANDKGNYRPIRLNKKKLSVSGYPTDPIVFTFTCRLFFFF